MVTMLKEHLAMEDQALLQSTKSMEMYRWAQDEPPRELQKETNQPPNFLKKVNGGIFEVH